MAPWKPEAQTLKEFVLNNVNNRLGHDVQEKVMPQVEGFGGCQGLANSLGGSLTAGIKAEEVQARKEPRSGGRHPAGLRQRQDTSPPGLTGSTRG